MGFPSPAEDFIENKLDLNEYIIKKPASTFFVKMGGNSMRKFGITEGDILVVDKSIEAYNNCIAVCVLDGNFTVRKLLYSGDIITLTTETKYHPDIRIIPENDFIVWGVVTFVIKKL